MGNFKAFMRQNAIAVENEKFVASKRFIDEKGEPIPWEIKVITSKENEALRKASTKRVPTGKRGQQAPDFDQSAYIVKLCVASTVFPDLNDKDLQDSYGVMGAEDLIRTMLTSGEYDNYALKVAEVNGFDVDMDEMVDEAKN